MTSKSDIKVVVTGIDSTTSSNNYTFVNRNTKRATTKFVYNRRSDVASIWSTTAIGRTNCNTNRLDYSAIKTTSNFWITGLETTYELTFLTNFWSRIMGRNLEYMWGNVKGIVTDNN